jgi:hypothetical protein
MRPVLNLTFEAVRDLLAKTFRGMADGRDARRIEWKLADVLMSGFAMLFFQHPSLLDFQRRMKEGRGRSNLERMFGVREIPSDTQMREILDGVEIEGLRGVLKEIFERMRRTGWTVNWVTEVGGKRWYTVALDGSEYFHSTRIDCPGCLKKELKSGVTHYSHVVVAGTLVKAGSRQVLPLDVEEVRNEDGREKQDCEINAGKRLIERLRAEHRQMPMCVVGDDLYAHEPFVEKVREQGMAFVLVAKPESHKELFEWVEELDRMGECGRGTWTEGPAGKRRFFEYRFAHGLPLTQSGRVTVNFIEVWERDRTGKLLYHNSWITDFDITPETAPIIVGIGRSRWKIENEHFNIHKNHGYELEHNYGHGQRTLSMVMYLLNLLAFVTHLVVEFGDRLYQQCRARLSRRSVWSDLRCLFDRVALDSWSDLLRFFLGDPLPDSS